MRKGKFWKGKSDVGIIIIQGWTSYLRQIDPLAKALNKQGYWVYAPVLSGHDSTPEKLEGVTWMNWEQDTVEAIDKIKRENNFRKIFIIGVSFGGNLAILASLKRKIDGIILISTPIFLRDHYWTILSAQFLSFFKKNMSKSYPKILLEKLKKPVSYNYFPIKSSLECFKLIKKSRKVLSVVEIPFFIIQTNKDYLVAPYSPWLMYNKIKSIEKSLYWMDAGEGIHIDFVTNPEKYGEVIDNFIGNIKKK
jgi:carboxylesterase